MVDVFLIIVCIIFTGLALLAGFYIVIAFQTPEMKGKDIFAKIIVILSLGVATMNVLMLPLDALNREGTLHIDIMCWIFTIISAVLAFIITPAVTNYYENKDDDDVKHPLCKALLVPIPFIIFVIVLFLILWFAVGRCEIPITVYSGDSLTTAVPTGACTKCRMFLNVETFRFHIFFSNLTHSFIGNYLENHTISIDLCCIDYWIHWILIAYYSRWNWSSYIAH